jgi:peptidoglycan/LPS O-acetylase OafA/YrhL
MTVPTPEKAKIHSLDGLRGLMAIWVVVGHVSLTFGWGLPVFERNNLAVDVFVLLSGFVIAMLIERKREPYASYIIRRAFRLFPLYLAALALSAILLPAQMAAWQHAAPTPQNVNRLVLATRSLWDIAAGLAFHIPLLQGLVPKRLDPQAAFTIVGQAWSISLEWQFYLLAPVLIWATQAGNLRKTVAGALTVALLLVTARYFSGAYLGARVLHFLLGIVSFHAVHRSYDQKSQLAAAGGLFALILLAYGKLQIAPLGIWAVVIWSSARPAHSVGHALVRALATPRLVQLGEISFSIYLIHMIPLYCSVALLMPVLPLHGLVGEIGIMLVTLATSYGVAVMTHRWIEKPGIKLGARLTSVVGRADLNPA